jgi:hypothetical protein
MMDNRQDEIWVWSIISEIAGAADCATEAMAACSRALASIIAKKKACDQQ